MLLILGDIGTFLWTKIVLPQCLQLADCLTKLSPDYVITVADRYETIATAITSSYLNLKTIHIQGGEVTGSIDNKVRNE